MRVPGMQEFTYSSSRRVTYYLPIQAHSLTEKAVNRRMLIKFIGSIKFLARQDLPQSKKSRR